MKEMLLNMYRRHKYSGYEKRSFSQCGEDIIIDFIFFQLGIDKPVYLDIGAYHPFILSNTYLFYQKGASGVTIEPDPNGVILLNKYRHRDVTLQAGIGKNLEETEANFYVMSSRRLSTLVKEEAMRIQASSSYRIKKVESIKLLPISTVFQSYFYGQAPDFISLDVEGFDLEILRTIDFELYRPKVFCVETIEYEEKKASIKNEQLIRFLVDNGYFVYADTYINTIFVDKAIWESRGSNLGEHESN